MVKGWCNGNIFEIVVQNIAASVMHCITNFSCSNCFTPLWVSMISAHLSWAVSLGSWQSGLTVLFDEWNIRHYDYETQAQAKLNQTCLWFKGDKKVVHIYVVIGYVLIYIHTYILFSKRQNMSLAIYNKFNKGRQNKQINKARIWKKKNENSTR